IIDSSDKVSYAGNQSLTDAQQLIARSNIYAAPYDAMQNSNILFNPGFSVAQNSASLIINPLNGAPYWCDGWCVSAVNTTHTLSAQRIDYTATPLAGGYFYALILTCSAGGGAGYGVNEVIVAFQRVEGNRVRRLQWGTANAQPLTITFWA